MLVPLQGTVSPVARMIEQKILIGSVVALFIGSLRLVSFTLPWNWEPSMRAGPGGFLLDSRHRAGSSTAYRCRL